MKPADQQLQEDRKLLEGWNRLKVHFSSLRLDWKTPKAVYQTLDAEFQFDHDPCPAKPTQDGLLTEWGGCRFAILLMETSSQSGSRKAGKSTRKEKQLCFLSPAEQTQDGGTNTA